MLIEKRFLDCAECLKAGHAGIGEQNIDAPELLPHDFHQARNLGKPARIRGQDLRRRTQFPARRRDTLGLPASEDNLRALLLEELRCRQSDSSRSPRD
ncbi:MAG TPA: hypothetical protein VHC72_21850 [Bryobacteraceae bacterium]|nr:hypothetical protein [Bryobacteraceae bacterium]